MKSAVLVLSVLLWLTGGLAVAQDTETNPVPLDYGLESPFIVDPGDWKQLGPIELNSEKLYKFQISGLGIDHGRDGERQTDEDNFPFPDGDDQYIELTSGIELLLVDRDNFQKYSSQNGPGSQVVEDNPLLAVGWIERWTGFGEFTYIPGADLTVYLIIDYLDRSHDNDPVPDPNITLLVTDLTVREGEQRGSGALLDRVTCSVACCVFIIGVVLGIVWLDRRFTTAPKVSALETNGVPFTYEKTITGRGLTEE